MSLILVLLKLENWSPDLPVFVALKNQRDVQRVVNVIACLVLRTRQHFVSLGNAVVHVSDVFANVNNVR